MKKYILTLCLAIFSACFNTLAAQNRGTQDEFIGIIHIDDDPQAGGNPRTRCNRTYCEGHENISFSLNNTPHALRMEALVNSIERKGLSDWLFIQESIIKNELDTRNRHVSSTYEFARNEYFANFEKSIANTNIPILSSGRNRIINEGKSKRTLSLKDIKLLKARLQEIKNGNINRSLYANKTYNSRPMSVYKTESSINSVLNTANERFFANEVKINEDLLIRDQLNEMLRSIRAVNQLGVTDNTSKVLKNKQIGHYNNFNRWQRISLMQRYLSGLKKGSNSGNIWPKEFGTKNYLLAYAKEHRKKDIDFFHKDYWKVILKKDFGNNFLKSRDAINKYIRLRDAELTRLLNTVSININSSVDFLVSELNITKADQLKWLNNNASKAKEMESVLKLTKLNPNPNVYNSTKKNTKIRILENGTVEEMITKLKLDAYRKYLYDDEEMAYDLRVFAYQNSPGGNINAAALAFIKEALEAVKNGGEIDVEDRIINKLTNPCAKSIFEELENGIFEDDPLKPEVQISVQNNSKLNFVERILKLFNDSNKTHYTVKNSSIGAGVAAVTDGKTNVTTFHNSYLQKATKLSIARTIIHESIHAYLNSVYFSRSDLIDKPFREKLFKFASEGGYTSFNRFQHEFMSQYVKAMAYSLYKWDKIYGKGKGNNNINKPDDLLGWNYYIAMAYGGLYYIDKKTGDEIETDSFKALVPSKKDRDQIKIIIENEQNNNINSKGTKC